MAGEEGNKEVLKIITGDNLENLADIESNSIDLTVTSPPYDDIRTYGNNPQYDLHKLGIEVLRVTKDGGIAAVIMQDGTKDFAKSLTTFRTAVDWCDNGWRLFECCIYARNGRPGKWWNQRFRVDHEYILLFLKGERPRFFDKEHLKIPAESAGRNFHGNTRLSDGSLIPMNGIVPDMKCRGTIWDFSHEALGRDPLRREHPAPFPDAIPHDIIRTFTQPGDTVLDPFLGSGTTALVANALGRSCIGIEISPEYVAIAKNRLGLWATTLAS